MKQRHMLGIAVIIAFIAFCGFTFSQSLTPYVSFKDAMGKNSVVQVKGELADGLIKPLNDGTGITFTLRDSEGTVARVLYAGIEPENMSHAESVVVVGKYVGEDFSAEQILVKCPSKYQGKH